MDENTIRNVTISVIVQGQPERVACIVPVAFGSHGFNRMAATDGVDFFDIVERRVRQVLLEAARVVPTEATAFMAEVASW